MVVATLIGIVSSSIESIMLSLRKGKTIVVEKNHIIILGWNDQIFSIIRELQLANENQNGICVVVMADEDPELMQDEVENRVDITSLDMVYRSCNVLDIDDLIHLDGIKKLIPYIKKNKFNLLYLKKNVFPSIKNKIFFSPYRYFNKSNLNIFFRNSINMQSIAIIYKKKRYTHKINTK